MLDLQYLLPLFLSLIVLALAWTAYHNRPCLFSRKKKSSIPTNWPGWGMLPGLLLNYNRLHDYITDILLESGGTFCFKGPWLYNSDIIITSDPENFRHILCRNFSNYPKGPDYQKIFDILGDGIFSSEGELWKIHREVNSAVLHSRDLQKSLQDTVQMKLVQGLLPMLETYANGGMVVDLQDIIMRFTFDVFSISFLDDDPGSLSIDLPSMPTHAAFIDIEKCLMQKHITVGWFWSLQRWAGRFGLESKLRDGVAAIDQYIYRCIDKNLNKSPSQKQVSALTTFVNAYTEKIRSSNSTIEITNSFLRDVVLSFLFAGRDTLSSTISWLFFLLAKNPGVEAKILQEIKHILPIPEWNQIACNMNEYSPRLIYLHAAICETLRLYPPIAVNHKASEKPDVLPSGVGLNTNSKLALSFYSMGRMESLWGKDCLEFKPERWINEHGKLRHVPSYVFPAFNAGPRTCLGKDISFSVTKIVVVPLVCNYHVELVQAHPVIPSTSIVIHMKHGLKVKLRKRI